MALKHVMAATQNQLSVPHKLQCRRLAALTTMHYSTCGHQNPYNSAMTQVAKGMTAIRNAWQDDEQLQRLL